MARQNESKRSSEPGSRKPDVPPSPPQPHERRGEIGPQSLPGGLYVLATPIGAANDITLRGIEALRAADMLVCEDSRVLKRLLSLHGVELRQRKLVVYHDHNAQEIRPQVLEALKSGASVVLTSDAGTPLVSDPGFRLVAEAHDAEVPVRALPGPSAAIAALSIAGLPCDRFVFLGFLPPRSGPRERELSVWSEAPATLILYETGARLAKTLRSANTVLGNRTAAVCRELTKTYEEVRRGTLSELLAAVEASGRLKGEIVLLIAPRDTPRELDLSSLDTAIREGLKTASVKEISRTISEQMSISRKIVYDRAVELSREVSGK